MMGTIYVAHFASIDVSPSPMRFTCFALDFGSRSSRFETPFESSRFSCNCFRSQLAMPNKSLQDALCRLIAHLGW